MVHQEIEKKKSLRERISIFPKRAKDVRARNCGKGRRKTTRPRGQKEGEGAISSTEGSKYSLLERRGTLSGKTYLNNAATEKKKLFSFLLARKG